MKKTLLFSICLFLSISYSHAQDAQKIEELKEGYFKDKKYSEFVEYLKSLNVKDNALAAQVDYYKALSRYQQLKYLEETQNWNEYFSQGNTYRDEVVLGAQKAIDSTKNSDSLNIYARLLLWQFHKDKQDAFADTALSGLVDSAVEYSKTDADPKPVKDAADKLFSYQEKGKSKELYRIYVEKITSSDIKDEQFREIAFGFYKEGNLELSEIVYDSFIDRIIKSLPKEKTVPDLINIAKMFAYKNEGPNDALYAEKIFKKIEDTAGKEALGEELVYLRAFNLEKAKEFLAAKDVYVDLAARFPLSSHVDEANYKIAVIFTYVSRDIKTGREYFDKLSQKEPSSPQAISSLYHLGLLSQWENDTAKAKDYYSKLVEKSKDGFHETSVLAKLRLKEIDELKPIEYNLKTFLDAALKEDLVSAITPNINASLYILNKDQEVKINSATNVPMNGCMPVELQYLWSGEIGKTRAASEELLLSALFDTSYSETGTKVINLTIVSPAGTIDRSIDMVDVY